jgi:hypothetical protein
LTPENWPSAGHYTQIVWKDTKKVGCGAATSDGKETIIVCRYSLGPTHEGGNVFGENPY